MDYTVHGILQDRILEWLAIPFSRGPSPYRDWNQVSHIAGGFFSSWATREAQEYWSGQPSPSPADLPNPGIYCHCKFWVVKTTGKELVMKSHWMIPLEVRLFYLPSSPQGTQVVGHTVGWFPSLKSSSSPCGQNFSRGRIFPDCWDLALGRSSAHLSIPLAGWQTSWHCWGPREAWGG